MSFSRSEVPESRKWRTEDIFASIDDWTACYDSLTDKLDFSVYEGKLGDTATLLGCFEKLNSVTLKLNWLSVYAFMKHDEDTRDSTYTALLSRVDDLEMKLSGAVAFIEPELTALPTETLESFAKDPALRDYDYTIKKIIKQKPHVLSKETEAVLSQGSRMFDTARQVFSMIDNADFPFPTIKVDGKPTKVTHGTYGVLLRSDDRDVRRKAFKAYYGAYIGLINTITATYTGNVDKDVFLARARKYDSCLDRAMSSEDVPEVVYTNLLDCVHKGLKHLHRYYLVRKKLLGLTKQHMYDIYTPVVDDAEIKVDYEEAFRIVKDGLAPLGERYSKLLDEAHDNGWIDVEETDGKRSGAYSISVYGLKHPYVLLNYQQCTSDVFTIAHELGHAMHSYHSERSQPQEKADYKIFVAEVASTVNEVLLYRHLLSTANDPKLKKYLLSYYMDMLKGTMFRQTQFAEFEYEAHRMAENGVPLTKDSLSEMYLELNRKYYGRSVVSDPEIAYEWARIPHFYRALYVYKYATGIISAVSIANRILAEGQPAVDDYFRFLSSGGSDSPVELLKLAGVDLTKKDAFRSCINSFVEALDEFEKL